LAIRFRWVKARQSAGGREGHPSQDFSAATKADRCADAEATAESTVASGANDAATANAAPADAAANANRA